jgi:hypothetical protein
MMGGSERGRHGKREKEMRLESEIGHLLEPRIPEVHVSHSLGGLKLEVIH